MSVSIGTRGREVEGFYVQEVRLLAFPRCEWRTSGLPKAERQEPRVLVLRP